MGTIIDEFVLGLPAEVGKLLSLIKSEDMVPLRRVAHQLRGAGGGYGFDEITERASIVENSIKASENRESISQQIDSLIDVIRRVEGFDFTREPLTEEIEDVQIDSHR
jgi:chemotaxis protein histidine kinase CheA